MNRQTTRSAAVLVLLAVACKPEPKACSTWRATQGTCVRTAVEESDVDDPSLVRVKFAYVWQGEPATRMPFEWIIPKSRLPALRDPMRDRVACERMTSGPSCLVWVLPEKSARDAPPPPGAEARDAICSPARSISTPLLDEAVLESVLGPSSGAWQRTNLNTAGVADAIYVRGPQHVRVTVRDMIHACTGAAGSGEILLETEGDAKAIRERVLSATSAVLLRWPPDRARLVMWIADRCQVVVDGVDGVPSAELPVVGRAVDVTRLATMCAAR